MGGPATRVGVETTSLDPKGPAAGHREEGTRSTVFGLDVRADVPLSFLARAPARPTGRTFDISVSAAPAPLPAHAEQRAQPAHPQLPAAPGWPDSAELVCDQRERDGTVSFRIESAPDAGYLIWGPAYGSHLLSPDGRRVLCMPEGRPEGTWQRLLIAQVLPFAALLRGLEVFHASAVVTEGGAVAFVGPSRSGKTSVALELCRLGAGFLADDVLAVEQAEGRLLGQPGTPVAGLDHAEAQRLDEQFVGGVPGQSLEDTPQQRPGDAPRRSPGEAPQQNPGGAPWQEVVAINARERLVRMRGAAEPAPLAALFFLDRRPDGPSRPRFEPAADARALLSATFNSVLTGPERLRGMLDICARAARGRVERVLVGPKVNTAQLASAIERRLGSSM